MRVERKSGAVLIETGMFAAMVAAVATVLMMVIFAKGLVGAVAIGGTVGVVVAVAMWLLMRGTLEPPRGPGNIPTPGRAPTAAAPKAAAPKTATPTAASAPASETTTEVGTAPATLSAARDGQADDLKQIKGVGPKLEQQLNAMGFYHFDQVASWTEDEVAWVDENITGFKGRATRDDWVGQARVLIAGG